MQTGEVSNILYMNNGFWRNLKKPIMALAPLANVTDAAFRRIIAKYSKPRGPHVMYTEFVSADGLFSPGREVLMKDLLFSNAERPIVAQFFSGKPENIERAAALAMKLNFDGVDINMGCPDRSIEKQGAGAALIKDPKRARTLIAAARKGAPRLPISVKTRIGYNKNEIETWLPELLKEDPVAVILHLRTRKEMSKVPARWDVAKHAVSIRDSMKSKTLILGNGDVADISDAYMKVKKSGVDGVMFGKAIFGNPWLWSGHTPTVRERLFVMIEHTKLFEELFMNANPIRTCGRETRPTSNGAKNFAVMKKHYKAYAEGFPGAKELRIKLMEAKNVSEVKDIVTDFLRHVQ